MNRWTRMLRESGMRLSAVASSVVMTIVVAGPVAAQQPAPKPPAPTADAPPPARELTPAEISVLQTIMTNRANGTVLTPGNADAIRRNVYETQKMMPPPLPMDGLKPRPRNLTIDPQVALEQPESIQLALGVVTPLTFLDSDGRPWPVESVAFDPRMLAQDGNGCGSPPPNGAVVGAGERPTTITMMPCRINTFANVSVKLEGFPLPIVLMAKSGGGGSVDLPVTIRVKGRSPNAPAMPAEAMAAYSPPAVHYAQRKTRSGARSGDTIPDRYLDTFGAGAPPANAQRVQIDDPSVTGWIFDGKLYLRGSVTVVNPAQDAVAESVGGMKVWRFDHPVPRILVVDERGNERDIAVNF